MSLQDTLNSSESKSDKLADYDRRQPIRACKGCGEEKPIVEFYSTGDSRRLWICKSCVADKFQANRSDRVALLAEYDRLHPTRVCTDCGEEKTIDKFVIADTISRLYRCKECRNASARRKRHDDPEFARKANEKSRRYQKRRRSSLDTWASYTAGKLRARTRSRGIPCTVVLEDIQAEFDRTNGRCPILGTTFVFGEPSMRNASIDRIDPGRGYEPGNIRIISKRANAIKNNATAVELFKVAIWALQAQGLTSQNQAEVKKIAEDLASMLKSAEEKVVSNGKSDRRVSSRSTLRGTICP